MTKRSPTLALAFFLCAASISCAKGSPLSPEDLQVAKTAWGSAGYSSYRLVLKITGDTIETGTFDIEVREGAITEATRNGAPLKNPDTFYTVRGLYKFLEDELELAEEPGRYFGAGKDSRIYMLAHFDPENGAPLRYLRAITETKHNIVVEVKELTPL